MDRVNFVINNVHYSVGCEVDSTVTLNDYLRHGLNLRGTKYMCKEGGCGACIVTVTAPDPSNGAPVTFAVNSCLVSITSCQGWEITTIEEVGNRSKGYHPIQKALADHNGTQCGYCTPGWVMAMYSLNKSKGNTLSAAEIENSFASNVCRCTGYRPILDAFKSMSSDESNLIDIEELNITCDKSVCKNGTSDNEWCFINKDEVSAITTSIQLKDGKKWFRVTTVRDIFWILHFHGFESYMLVAGNTAKGVYPITEYPKVLIDISGVAELKSYIMDQNLVLGAGVTLTDMMRIFKYLATSQSYFGYLKELYDHIDLVANIPVKNIGTVAGNLMIKHNHNEFPSDLFLLFETVDARITIENFLGFRLSLTPEAFLNTDMRKKIIRNIMFPPLSSEYSLVTYKIMERSQNVHAIVNAGFLYKFDRNSSRVKEARIVFGGLSSKFVHARRTELFLIGKNLFTNDTLQVALKILENELIVEEMPPEPSAKSRKKIALGLFYKGLLELCPPRILHSRYKSGAEKLRLTRPVSQGKQVFDTNPALWPLNQPIPKVEALIQCAGEAPYMDDIPTMPREVFAAFVLSTVATGTIESIDASAALGINGVIDFFTAKHIPGKNSYTPTSLMLNNADEEVFCDGTVKYFNQPVGLIVAETDKLANTAAKMVKIKYKNIKAPVLTIREAKTQTKRVILHKEMPAESRGSDVIKVIKSSNDIYGQYHFTMEVQTCITLPSDDGFEVYCSTQWMDAVQVAISEALKIDQNRINMKVRRLGGAYGAKISRATLLGVSCSLVSYHLNRPCRIILPLTTNMKAIGKRLPCSADYEVGVNNIGEIQYLIYNVYEDDGYVINEPFIDLGLPSINNCYNKRRWEIKTYDVTTDTASNTWCRSPGTLEQIAMTEHIMEQISYELSLDPITVRMTNLDSEYSVITEITETLKNNADYDTRLVLVKKFNEENRWKKRGLRYVPLNWPVPVLAYFNVCLAIYHNDGSVAITHGGIEIGQGINTKAVQVCAYTLKIPIDKVKVKASDVISNANSSTTGGSFTSEAICLGIIKCCQIIQERLAPIKKMIGDPTWEVLIKTAYDSGVNLVATYTVNFNDLKEYRVYGATIAEVELDILTGEMQVLRVDLLEDVGQSLSPEIDVGQVEGAFIMGLGYWTCEKLVYDKKTGELLTDRTWNYNVPQAKDIPLDFRVYFRRNSYNELGILGSKATGEPATCMSIVVAFALRAALVASRQESGFPTTQWFCIDGPYSNDKLVLAAEAKIEEFKFN